MRKPAYRPGIRTNLKRPVAVVCAAAHIDAMEAVFILHHVRADDEYGDDAKLIGAYRTESDAKAATERLSGQPGFVDHPEGWQIDRYVLNHDQWSEGFVGGITPAPAPASAPHT
ncbi:hypothetical protein GCM10017612_35610 [Novosphingobium resinovorum]|nr:hypothetical protein GCM10017612_35610 [Novosphingobium resinovorum]